MTKITSSLYNERCYFEANGHAVCESDGFNCAAVSGEDEKAVCAAVSILMLAAYGRFAEMDANGDFVSAFLTLENGYALFDVQPREDARERTEEIIDMLMCGLSMLEENYPQLIQVA
jgi:uncharacterized protein YsxB (DUF464 family)